MIFTTNQLIAHLVGDYLIQSDWQANQKTKSFLPAFFHAFTYALVFVSITQNPITLLCIMLSHFLIDRYRLARFVIFMKNLQAPKEWRFGWKDCSGTGYHKDRPAWLSVWLLIITDNTIHILLNGVFIYLFG